ncbi:type II toxin-antitoxin system PemK/MazF family toxin [Xanthobacter sediminis]|uniref:type II toxin-antitoxin system PemK/MazF family toxin n=1 Tax=Xanthobacter sediminis TaxID=3119926 RepID=UPI00372C6C0F
MRRGDLVTVAASGDFGKPRPALVIQADHFDQTGSVTVVLVTSMPVDAPLIRLSVAPEAQTGLPRPSQVMIDKTISVRRDKVGPVFGHLDGGTMLAVSRLLAVFLGIA